MVLYVILMLNVFKVSKEYENACVIKDGRKMVTSV